MLNFCLPESSSLFSFSSSRRLQFHRHHMQNIWKSLWITVSMSYVDHQFICVGSCCTVSCQLATIINAVCMSGSRTRFSKYSMSGSSRIFMISSWYRKKNRIFWSCVVQITKMLLKTVFNSATAQIIWRLKEEYQVARGCLIGKIFRILRVRQYRILFTSGQSVYNIRFMECFFVQITKKLLNMTLNSLC